MLPGVVITADRKNETGINPPVIPAEDFSYLTFNVADYMEADAVHTDAREVLPETSEADYSYLKFNSNDYRTDSELIWCEESELPANENNAFIISTPEPVAIELEYLRFDVTYYINNNMEETAGIGNLPLEETNTGNQSLMTALDESKTDSDYLKFAVAKYYNPDYLTYTELFESPEE